MTRRDFQRSNAGVPRPAWEHQYVAALIMGDLIVAVLAAIGSVLLRYGGAGVTVGGLGAVGYLPLSFGASLIWPLFLAQGRAYDLRVLGSGSEEFRRVGNTAIKFVAALGLAAFIFKQQIARSLLLEFVPALAFLTVSFRGYARGRLHAARRTGRCSHRVLVAGTSAEVAGVVERFANASRAGMLVIGVCLPDGNIAPDGVRVAGSLGGIAQAAVDATADTVVVAGPAGFGSDGIRKLGWALEGTGVDLLVAPSLTDIVGTRLTVRPVEDMVLLHIAAPTMSGPRRFAKGCLDRIAATLGLLVLLPLLLLAGVAIRVTSPGPALFRQRRVGRDGREFTCFKFRSMYRDAEARQAALDAQSDTQSVLFKMREDPRVTSVGKFLRRFSVDELPQLANVVLGHMSLVGPRPPLPGEVRRYEAEVHRRLLVKPGLTGLWQVSGRSDLPWEKAVELDLYYVANWSPMLDLMILLRTAGAVLFGRGAY